MRRADVVRDVSRRARARIPVPGLALLGLATAACGGDATSPLTPANVTGTYALASIDGHPLPAPYGHGTTVIYDTLTLAHDSTLVERQGGGAIGSSVVTDSGAYTGHWALNASGGQVALIFPVAHGNPITVTYTVVNRGASLTVDVPRSADPGGGLWVYNHVR